MIADITLPEIDRNGFAIVENIYTAPEIEAIINMIDAAVTSSDTFRKSGNLFAIRQFLKELPETMQLVFNAKLKEFISCNFGNCFIVKSIYFDKPGESNWFVAYHQDLTISVKEKVLTEGYSPWTVKHNQYAVQPPIDILENIFTIRIHLDDTNSGNGALKVIPNSHSKGLYRPETIDWNIESETICEVPAGGIMIMRSLLLHSSARSTNNHRRRVIHIEFCNLELPEGLEWAEKMNF